jgi:serine/threonine-protein kinase RsbW
VHAPSVQPVNPLDLAAGLVDTRRLVRAVATESRLSPARIAEVALAVHEVAMNAITHGRPPGAVRIRAEGDELVCEVEDHGPGISDPLAGTEPPDLDGLQGRGLWIARQLSDRVEIESIPGRTVVRLRWLLGRSG